jgi:predicted regulator of Ras-like GTPase activity (Roadblock/LC7/MglB family)
MNAFTIRPEQAQQAMRRLTGLTDVRHVVVIDAIGLCLAHVGHEPVSNRLLSDWTVVARAAFSACDQMGKRSGVGPCQEVVNSYADGGILMHTVVGGMLLVVHYGHRCPVEELRSIAKSVAQSLPTAVEIKPTPSVETTASVPVEPPHHQRSVSTIHEAEVL